MSNIKKMSRKTYIDFKKTVTDKLEGVTNSYNTFSNEITKIYHPLSPNMKKMLKTFIGSVEKMYQSQDDLTKYFQT